MTSHGYVFVRLTCAKMLSIIYLLGNSQKPFAVKPQTIFSSLKHTGLTAYHLIHRYLYWCRDKRPETQSWLLDTFHITAESRPNFLHYYINWSSAVWTISVCFVLCLFKCQLLMALKCWIMIENDKQLQWLAGKNQYLFFPLINAQETGCRWRTRDEVFWLLLVDKKTFSTVHFSAIWISRRLFSVLGSSLIHAVCLFDTESFHTLLEFKFLLL